MATSKEIIATAYDDFAKGDVPAVLAVMDPKIEWTEAEGWPLYVGGASRSSFQLSGLPRRPARQSAEAALPVMPAERQTL